MPPLVRQRVSSPFEGLDKGSWKGPDLDSEASTSNGKWKLFLSLRHLLIHRCNIHSFPDLCKICEVSDHAWKQESLAHSDWIDTVLLEHVIAVPGEFAADIWLPREA